eukprot:Clim_evm13s143 gene=Clim_evmTU13s143
MSTRADSPKATAPRADHSGDQSGATSVESALSGAGKAVVYNVYLQAVLRAGTFVANLLLVRLVSQWTLGVANVRLMLLYSTVTTLTREPFRRACLGSGGAHGRFDRNRWKPVTNLMWWAPVVGMVLCMVMGYVWVTVLLPGEAQMDDPYAKYGTRDAWEQSKAVGKLARSYYVAVGGVLVGCLLELTAEPVHVALQAHLYLNVRVLAEGLGLIARLGALFGGLFFIAYVDYKEDSKDGLIQHFLTYNGYADHKVLPIFGFAHVLQSLVILVVNWGYLAFLPARDNVPTFEDLMPDADGVLPEVETARAVGFVQQIVTKQFLTEGEKYAMTFFNIADLAKQGIHDLVNNLGSLLVRFVFLPVEDAFFQFFSHTMSLDLRTFAEDNLQIAVLERAEALRDDELSPEERQERDELVVNLREEWELERKNRQFAIFVPVTRLLLVVGVIVAIFAQGYSHILLMAYGGSKLGENEPGGAPETLRMFSVTMPLLALNGMGECLHSATAGPSQLRQYNMAMVGFSICFMAMAVLMSQYYGFGLMGLIYANWLNMVLRITYCSVYIGNYFFGHRTKSTVVQLIALTRAILPSMWQLIGFLIIGSTTHWLLWDLRIIPYFVLALIYYRIDYSDVTVGPLTFDGMTIGAILHVIYGGILLLAWLMFALYIDGGLMDDILALRRTMADVRARGRGGSAADTLERDQSASPTTEAAAKVRFREPLTETIDGHAKED